MFCISIAYPQKDNGRFDFDYYASKHIPLVARRLGSNCVKTEIRKGVASADGSIAAFVCLANIWINSVQEFQVTLAQHAAEIFDDIPNYTNLQPLIQVDEVIG